MPKRRPTNDIERAEAVQKQTERILNKTNLMSDEDATKYLRAHLTQLLDAMLTLAIQQGDRGALIHLLDRIMGKPTETRRIEGGLNFDINIKVAGADGEIRELPEPGTIVESIAAPAGDEHFISTQRKDY